MSDPKKVVSMSGSPVWTYGEGKDWAPPSGQESIQQISDHIESWIGKVKSVFHEIISDTVHIDVHLVEPAADRPFHTLVTSGMSDLPMAVPANADVPRYTELMMTLPSGWQITKESFEQDEWYWPVNELKFLARFPHKHNTWLGHGHTVPNGDPPRPFASNTALCGIILLPPLMVPPEFRELLISNEKTIHFFSAVPIYEEEMNLKLRLGSRELTERFDKAQISDLVDVKRKNVARKRFGLF